ncbi:22655_t:CDS:1, partial [Racocetra persica]
DAVRSAKKRGGQCLSIQYTNNKDPLLWRCSNNHEWYASLHRLKNHNKWCPTCGHDKRRLGILTAKELALSKNGKYISDSYINNRTPLIWECEKLYRWQTTLNSVKNGGHWCQNCAGTEKLNLEIAKEVAISK